MGILNTEKDENSRSQRRLSRAAIKSMGENSPLQGLNRIGFIGLSPGAGTTTLVQAVADCLVMFGKKSTTLPKNKSSAVLRSGALGIDRSSPCCAVVEIANSQRKGTVLPFDKIDIGRHFAGRDYHPIHRLLISGKPISHITNISGGINWVLRMPGDNDICLETADMVSLISNVPGQVILSDISSGGDMDYRRILSGMHRIVLIIDPLPSALLAGKEIFELVQAAEISGIPVMRVINKMNNGVNMKEVRRFIGRTPDIFIPMFDGASVYRTEFACKTVFAEKLIAPHICALTQLLL